MNGELGFALARAAHLDTSELAIADLHETEGGALSLGAVAAAVMAPTVAAAFREPDVGHLRLVSEGVAGEEALGAVDPPELAVVGDNAVEAPDPVGQGVVDVHLDPLPGLGREADQRGLVAANDVLELDDHVPAPAAGSAMTPTVEALRKSGSGTREAAPEGTSRTKQAGLGTRPTWMVRSTPSGPR